MNETPSSPRWEYQKFSRSKSLSKKIKIIAIEAHEKRVMIKKGIVYFNFKLDI